MEFQPRDKIKVLNNIDTALYKFLKTVTLDRTNIGGDHLVKCFIGFRLYLFHATLTVALNILDNRMVCYLNSLSKYIR